MRAQARLLLLVETALLPLIVRGDIDSGIDLPKLAARSRRAVLLITGFDSSGKPIKTGTGFFVSANGLLVTNWHVVDGIAAADAKAENGATFKIGGVLAQSSQLDLAVLQANAKEVPFLEIAKNDAPETGTRIAVIGSPRALEGTLTDGIVSATRTDDANTWIQSQHLFRQVPVDRQFSIKMVTSSVWRRSIRPAVFKI